MTLQRLDDPFYYLNNFQTVLDWVGERYADLLMAHELDFIRAFATLPVASRALLVRMVMRKGTLFRASKLNYAEIGATRDAVQPLVAKGWVDAIPELTLAQLFALLTRAEILSAFRAWLAPGSASLKKAALLETLTPAFDRNRCFDAWCEGSEDCVYCLTLMDTCDRLRLMFFGNLRQDWSEFVLADLGVYRYESVEFTLASRAFHTRGEVDAYLHLHRCRERFEAGEAPSDVLADIPASPIDNPWLESRRARLLFQLGQQGERTGELNMALAVYANCTHPEARIRRVRVLERSERLDAALALARDAERAPENDAETQHLRRILPRLHRKLGLAGCPRRGHAPVERIDLTLPRPDRPLPVEWVACEHLSEARGPVYYVENTLLNSLFGLLCWEAIFAPLPGAFFHPFHSGPADLLRPDFYRRRAELFAACLAQLDSDAYQVTIRRHFAAKQDIQSPFVHWGVLHEALLDQALACLPPDHLRQWFERLLRDIQANRAGLPDLIQFWPEREQPPRYRMIEVKGPGDRLQDNQRRWLDFCVEHAMPVAVCHVQWTPTMDESVLS